VLHSEAGYLLSMVLQDFLRALRQALQYDQAPARIRQLTCVRVPDKVVAPVTIIAGKTSYEVCVSSTRRQARH